MATLLGTLSWLGVGCWWEGKEYLSFSAPRAILAVNLFSLASIFLLIQGQGAA